MTKLGNFVSEQIKTIVPVFDTVELKATIGSSSYSVEFFAAVDEKEMQCYEMIDEGKFTEEEFKAVSKAIADYIRKLPDFNANGLNKYTVVLYNIAR